MWKPTLKEKKTIYNCKYDCNEFKMVYNKTHKTWKNTRKNKWEWGCKKNKYKKNIQEIFYINKNNKNPVWLYT